MTPASCYSYHFVIPFTCMWGEPSNLLLMIRTQQRPWDGATKTRFKSVCHLLTHLSLVFLPDSSDEARCPVVGCAIERSKWQGTESSHWPTVSEKPRPQILPRVWWVSLEVDPCQLTLTMTALLTSWLIATWNRILSWASLGFLTYWNHEIINIVVLRQSQGNILCSYK